MFYLHIYNLPTDTMLTFVLFTQKHRQQITKITQLKIPNVLSTDHI